MILVCICGRRHSLREELKNRCDACMKEIRLEFKKWDMGSYASPKEVVK